MEKGIEGYTLLWASEVCSTEHYVYLRRSYKVAAALWKECFTKLQSTTANLI